MPRQYRLRPSGHIGGEGAAGNYFGYGLARRNHVHPARREARSEQRPFDVDEQQHATHRHLRQVRLSTKRRSDKLDLPGHTLDQGGAVATADHQRLDPGPPQNAACYPQVGLTPLALRVDHEHPGRTHRDVVDIGPGAPNPAIV